MKLPVLPSRKILKILFTLGFVERGQAGSHLTLKHPHKNLRVTIPIHNRDVPPGTLKSILKQAGISPTDFVKLLKKQSEG